MYSKKRNFFKRGARIFAMTLIFLSSAMSPFAVSCSATPFSGGKIKNCTTQGMMVYSLFENALPSGPNTFIGGIVGNVQNGVVENCENKMKLVVNHYMFSQQFVGGIAGRVDGILQNCRNEADFLIGGGNEIVFGEFAGVLSGGKLINCFSDKDKSYTRVGKVSGGNILIDPAAPKSSRP